MHHNVLHWPKRDNYFLDKIISYIISIRYFRCFLSLTFSNTFWINCKIKSKLLQGFLQKLPSIPSKTYFVIFAASLNNFKNHLWTKTHITFLYSLLTLKFVRHLVKDSSRDSKILPFILLGKLEYAMYIN